jgi:hypothetical protein
MRWVYRGNFMTQERADELIRTGSTPRIVAMERPAFEDRGPTGAPCRYKDWVYEKLGRGEYRFFNRYHIEVEHEGKSEGVPVCYCIEE